MFTFSLLVPIAQDKDLELSYCIPSVRIMGSSRIVVISQDTTSVMPLLHVVADWTYSGISRNIHPDQVQAQIHTGKSRWSVSDVLGSALYPSM